MKKRLAGLAMAGVLSLGMFLGAGPTRQAQADDTGTETVVMKDGTYQGTRYGYRSDVTISVTIKDGKITAVNAVSQNEDKEYWNKAKVLLDQILDEQSADLDTVSGATYSSRAILRAAQQAIDLSTGTDSSKPSSDIFAAGSGTREDPFQVATADQLRAFATSLSTNVDYEGYYVKLTADVDVSGSNWTPIGWTEDAMLQFQGDFDGAGHTISGLTFGTEDAAMEIDAKHRESGLFGIVGPYAKIHDLAIKDVQANISCPTTTHFGVVAGNTKAPSHGSVGTCVDGASVTGTVKVSTAEGQQRVGGILGYQNRGTIVINSWTDVDLTAVDATSWVQVGAISGINNGGLVANCYSLGDVTANGAKDNAVAASLISGNYGDVVNCYAMGNMTTNCASNCIGAVAGELDEGNAYNNWYNAASTLTVGDAEPVALPAVGTVNDTVAKENYISDDGYSFEGHVIDNNNSFTGDQLETAKAGLNGSFESFPLDIESLYGVQGDTLHTWAIKDGILTFSDDTESIIYMQPAAAYVPQATLTMKDGVWYGRDEDKTTTVKITTKDNKVISTEVVSGSNKASDVNKASAVAQSKAVYGDASGYGEADTSVFAGGSGTAEDPYQIANETQLRFIAEAINADTSWEGVYFKQTKDIKLSDQEWLPIGYMIQGYYKSKWQTFASYPFLGNYDGDNHRITGLTIGSKTAPSADTRMQSTAGFIGYTEGGVTNNYALEEDSVQREVKNVFIEDALINIEGLSSVYGAGLIGYARNGFIVEHCNVQGSVTVNGMESTLELTAYDGSTSTTSAATSNIYAGGLIGYGIRGGLVEDSAANVKATGAALDGAKTNVYAGGLYGMDNRMTSVNDYALGDVAATAAENRAYAGGLVGYSAGAHYNVYTMGSVTSANASSYVGGTSGIFKMVGADFNVYFNGDAKQTVAGAANPAPVAYGTQDEDADHNTAAAKSATELAGDDFAATMNKGIADVAANLPAQISDDPIHYCYYAGTGTDLRSWVAADGLVQLSAKNYPNIGQADKPAGEQADKPTTDTKATNAISGIKAAYTKTGNVSKAQSFSLGAKALGGTVSYKSNDKNVKVDAKGKVTIAKNYTGAAKITVSTAGNSKYAAASTTTTVKVKPGKMAVKQAKNVKKRSLKVTWKKMTGADKYQVLIATNKKMSKNKKSYNVKGSASSKTIKKLKKNKKYFVKIRAYDTQTKSWGAWGAVKKVKIAK